GADRRGATISTRPRGRRDCPHAGEDCSGPGPRSRVHAAMAAASNSRPEGAQAAAQAGARIRNSWLVRHPAEWRQVGIVAAYQGLLALMLFAPAWRHPLPFALACLLSFLNAVVIHNHMHRGIFKAHRLNMIWR